MAGPLSIPQRLRVIHAIREAEKDSSGEIRVHIQGKVKGDIMAAAAKKFIELGVDKTRLKNGALFFIAVKDRKLAVLGDTGISSVVPKDFWESTVKIMTERLSAGDLTGALEDGIKNAGHALKKYFPHQKNDKNELPDDISVQS
jgi:uncharacterized membrane protein